MVLESENQPTLIQAKTVFYGFSAPFKDSFSCTWQETGTLLFVKGQQEVATSLCLLASEAW